MKQTASNRTAYCLATLGLDHGQNKIIKNGENTVYVYKNFPKGINTHVREKNLAFWENTGTIKYYMLYGDKNGDKIRIFIPNPNQLEKNKKPKSLTNIDWLRKKKAYPVRYNKVKKNTISIKEKRKKMKETVTPRSLKKKGTAKKKKHIY